MPVSKPPQFPNKANTTAKGNMKGKVSAPPTESMVQEEPHIDSFQLRCSLSRVELVTTGCNAKGAAFMDCHMKRKLAMRVCMHACILLLISGVLSSDFTKF